MENRKEYQEEQLVSKTPSFHKEEFVKDFIDFWNNHPAAKALNSIASKKEQSEDKKEV